MVVGSIGNIVEGTPGKPAKVKCPDTMVLNIISDKIKGKKAIKFYRILFAGWNISYAPQLRSASWSRSRSTRTFARWPARTPATSMRWPISYVFLPVLAQMSSCHRRCHDTPLSCVVIGVCVDTKAEKQKVAEDTPLLHEHWHAATWIDALWKQPGLTLHQWLWSEFTI